MMDDQRAAAGGEATPAKRGRGRPAGDHAAKRAEILKAAIAAIAQDGYAGASLRGVAQHAGCKLGGVTYYFQSRDEIVTAVAERLFDVFDSLLEDEDSTDIRAVFERWFGSGESHDRTLWLALFHLVAHARDEPALAAVFRRRYAIYRERFAAILAKAQSQGVVRGDVAPDLLADMLSSVGDGWMMAFPIERERFAPARLRALFDVVMTVIAPPEVKAARLLPGQD